MSLTLNMVGGGSGGGISGSDALVRVIAPTGSTVSISKDGVTKTVSANDAHPLSDRNTVAAYLFPANSTGTWTVTATRGSDTNTATVSISDTDEYVVYVSYHVPITIYQEVEYLQATGSQYINLSLNTVQSGYVVDIDAEATAFTGSNPLIHFGTSASGSRTVGNIGTSGDGYYSAWFNNTAHNFGEISQEKSHFNVSFSSSSMDITVTDQSNHTQTKSWSFSIPTYGAVRLFNNTGGTQYGKYKTYYVLVANGNTPVRELYPCYRLSDSVAGLYDKANNVFYTNNGSGTFTVGADV